MKSIKILFLSLAMVVLSAQLLVAQSCITATVNEVKVTADKDLVDIALSSDNHTTLVAALKAADLVSALQGDGPFTIFAPTNAAFEALPEGTVATLLKAENKALLTNILTYHVVAGNFDAAKVVGAIKAGGGTATLEALNGGMINAYIEDGQVFLKDEKGGISKVSTTDLKGSNGVIHVIESVIMPK